ncbi:U4/U6.U5 tri-snRNP-associated protein 1 isoform X1 [Nasonia vitripennis]|uniref:U4/U6.U5 tri-snRNP-associated protein 1 n=1 Tax=Nasonia vitripennis TaxID=7425 RepID=A0A7M7QPR3_NASVI|nr:U4/U6.U5 tri-snRNP-associated protein 1 isoform X1 [Nasonia vitripennis]XP_016836823.1 U4/U6.U5 tri-snRNP-associated protein 1 isoform X1 [Nasonia vitripennis]XP_032451904.1 U4/U6.U5 tri-snRNP-associated protein 1 isoform X1 [Nasonia vitripennis]XP_032451905.1 U4/U6.U5 tri-snRNP-associated protein 1 isoform X1 [Nasonia vitripennis]
MGSSKRHKSEKSRESKKKRHRSRSRSVSVERERTERHCKHHKKHKKKDRKDYDSDVEIVGVPPPPKISRTIHLSTPPPPEIYQTSREERRDYSFEDRVREERARDNRLREDRGREHREDRSREERLPNKRRSPSPPKSRKSHESLSIEETNRIRAKLGLKPLEVDSGPKEGGPPNLIKDDLGEFLHKPAVNAAEKVKQEKLREKLAITKQKREIQSSLAAVKTLGEGDDDDLNTEKWASKFAQIQEEKRKAAERAKMLDQMDEAFGGIGDLVKEDIHNDLKNAYTNKDLKGLKVEHSLNNFNEGASVILTLKDQAVLAEEDDVLVNVNMIDDERYKKNVLVKSKKPGYDAYDESHYDEYGMPLGKVLDKYDEEIEGEKRDSFAIGMVDAKEIKERQVAMVKNRLANKRLESLQLAEPKIASDYYNESELEKFKKPKKKIRKFRTKKTLKADDLLTGTNDYLRDLGSRRRRHASNVIEIDDLEEPAEDLSGVKIEEDDRDVERIIKQKWQKIKEPVVPIKPEQIALTLKQEADMTSETDSAGNIILNSTAEFCRTLGDIPTYGQAGNRDENHQELMDFEMSEVKQEYIDEEMNGKCAWNSVEMDDDSVIPVGTEAAILDAEPSLDQGVGGALKLAMSKGYLQKEDSNRPSASRFAHLKAQNYSIEDKTYGDDDKFGRRDRFSGPTSDFKEKDGFRPNVKLDYIDDDGHILNAKEAFRYLSHKFHGKGPGKNKVEKRMKKAEQEILMKRMSSTDTPLGTLNLLQAKQKETQSPFILLSGSKHMQTASISKSKN